MNRQLFLTQQEDSLIRGFISRVKESPTLELEARWYNKVNPLKFSDFDRLFQVLNKNKDFKKKTETTRKIIYANNYFQLQKKQNSNAFVPVDGYFRKTRHHGDVSSTQYGFRVMLSSELRPTKEEFENHKGNQAPFLRERQRTSFVLGLYSFDLTVSRQGATISELEDPKNKETYEVEIEYIGNQKKVNVAEHEIYNTLLQNIGFVVSILQDSSVILGDQEKRAIIHEYDRNFLNRHVPQNRRTIITSPMVKPIDIDHKTLPLLKEGYSVTEKADGLHMVAFISGANLSPLYFIQHIGRQLKIRKSAFSVPQLKGTVLDGEYIILPNGSLLYLVIDILWLNGQDVRQMTLLNRLGLIQNKVMPFLDPRVFAQKAFHFQGNIHALSKTVLDSKFPYEIDGLIFTPINAPYDKKVRNIYKWKPHKMLTIDFLVIRDMNDETQWKLYMNSKGNQAQLFSHPKFPDAGSLKVSKETNRKFKDSSVIEFEWTGNSWNPIRSRPDKVVGNFVTVTEAVFSLILDPVTKAQITGQEQFYEPVETTIEARKEAVTIGLRNFHNWVKATLIEKYTSPGSFLADFGSGKGGDIRKWQKAKLRRIEGFDVVSENVAVAEERAKGRKHIHFHVADLSKDNVQKVLTKAHGTHMDFHSVTSFFGIHYFFGSQKDVSTFFKNVAQSLKNSGRLIVTTFDAKEVHKLFKKKTKHFKTDKFEIIKKYEDKPYSQLPIYGNKITVRILDTELRRGISEYLVKPDKLINIAKRFGFELEMTSSFDKLYPLWRQQRSGNDMSVEEKQLSFLNRFYVFKRSVGNSLLEQTKMI